jgi:hypothetical protein
MVAHNFLQFEDRREYTVFLKRAAQGVERNKTARIGLRTAFV